MEVDLEEAEELVFNEAYRLRDTVLMVRTLVVGKCDDSGPLLMNSFLRGIIDILCKGVSEELLEFPDKLKRLGRNRSKEAKQKTAPAKRGARNLTAENCWRMTLKCA